MWKKDTRKCILRTLFFILSTYQVLYRHMIHSFILQLTSFFKQCMNHNKLGKKLKEKETKSLTCISSTRTISHLLNQFSSFLFAYLYLVISSSFLTTLVFSLSSPILLALRPKTAHLIRFHYNLQTSKFSSASSLFLTFMNGATYFAWFTPYKHAALAPLKWMCGLYFVTR